MTEFNSQSNSWSGSNPLFEGMAFSNHNALYEKGQAAVEPDVEMLHLDQDKGVGQATITPEIEKRETQNKSISSKATNIFAKLGEILSKAGQSIIRKAKRFHNAEAMKTHAQTQTNELTVNTIKVDQTNTYATARLNHKEITQNASSKNDLQAHIYKHLSFEEALFVERLVQMGNSGALNTISHYKTESQEAKMALPEIEKAQERLQHLDIQVKNSMGEAKTYIAALEKYVEADKELRQLLYHAQGPDEFSTNAYKSTKENYAAENRELKNLSGQVSMSNINKAISKAIKEHKTSSEGDAQLLSNLLMIREYSFKINQREDFRESKAKLDNVMNKLQSGENLADNEKLTNSDLRVLYSYTNFADTLSHFTEVRSGNTKLLSEITDTVTKLQTLEQKLRNESTAKPGNLVFFDLDAYVETSKGKKNLRDWVEGSFVSDLSHAGVINKEQDLHISHIWSKYESKPLNVTDFAVSTVYKLNVSELISDSNNDALILKEMYGENNVNSKLEREFAKIAKEFHSDTEQLAHLENSDRRQDGAASPIHTRRNMLGCAVEKDTQNINFKDKKEMICSEFAAKATLHCLNLLNEKIRTDYKHHLMQKHDLNSEMANSAVQDKSFLKHPIPSTEKLKRLHPERLYQFLAPHMTQVDAPPTLSKILKN